MGWGKKILRGYMAISRYTSPLRFPGGKSKIANFMKLVFTDNELVGVDYVEPYAGGAGLALHLLFNGYASHIHINDINKALNSFWYVLLNDTDNLCRLIYDTKVDIDTRDKQKEIQLHSELHSNLDLAFSTFFLNRTNISGIISGGVIGGISQKGKWLIDARYNKDELISRIERIARRRENITLYNEDAKFFIERILPTLPINSLIYLDPPYYIKGSELYENHYLHNDHVSIARRIRTIKQKWIISYDDNPEILDLYDEYRYIRYRLSYSAAEHYHGAEIMFFCNDINIPLVENPAKIPGSVVA